MFRDRHSIRIYAFTILLPLFLATGSILYSQQAEDTDKGGNISNTLRKEDPADKTKKPSDSKIPDAKKEDTGRKTKPEPMDDSAKAQKIDSTLDYGIQKDRKMALARIVDIKDEQLRAKLVQKAIKVIDEDTDIEVRKTAITVLGDLKSRESGPVMIKALDDTSEEIKIAACYAISKIGVAEARPKLVEMFNKQELIHTSNLTDAIIQTLSDMKANDILAQAEKAVKDAKTAKMVKERLILYVGNTGSAAQKDFLVSVYKDEDEEIILRSYAVKSIAKLKIKEAAPDIKKLIKEIDSQSFNQKKKYYELHIHSIAALVELGDAEAVPLLMGSLRSDNASVRLKAVGLIKDFNDERTIDILKYKMKNDPSAKVRKAARKALEAKGLVEKGKDDDKGVEDYDREFKDE